MPTATAMSEDILINVTPFETRVALVEQEQCRNCMSSAASSAAM